MNIILPRQLPVYQGVEITPRSGYPCVLAGKVHLLRVCTFPARLKPNTVTLDHLPERGKKAQLAYSFDIALQNEFPLEENIAHARQFVSEQLVGRGMIADFAIQQHKEDGGTEAVFAMARAIEKWEQFQIRK